MAEMVGAVLSPIVKDAYHLMKRHICYAFKCKRNVNTLKEGVEALNGEQGRLKHLVERERRNGKLIERDVDEWLEKVGGIVKEGKELVQASERAEMKCFFGFCPNFMTRYRVSRKAEKKATELANLLKKREGFSRIPNSLQLKRRTGEETSFHSSKEMENSQNSYQGNINDQVLVDVTELTESLKKKFKQLHLVSRECCIDIVPERVKKLNEKAYTPQCVSIGPYHRGKLKAMEEHKIMYLQHFLKYSQVSLEEFVSWVRDNETRLRNSYQERIDLESKPFVELMVIDAAFVIMVMLSRCIRLSGYEEEPLPIKPWMIYDILWDMILLENQLPFFILDHFLNLADGRLSMVMVLCEFFGDNISSQVDPYMELDLSESEVNPYMKLDLSKSKHLVDFLRWSMQPSKQNKQKIVLNVVNLRSAMELHRVGVKFELDQSSSPRLADINFCDGIFKIPLLKLHSATEIVFRNLQAFEQCQISEDQRYFNDYITMICFLVTNEKDVELLTKEGIIVNWLHNNEQVVHLLHNLNKQNVINKEKFYFSDVIDDLNRYCNKRRNRWRASLMQGYFHNPWAAISVIAAIFIILLTMVQTICSILQVKQQQ